MIRSPAMERRSKLLHLRKPSTKKVILLANYQAEKKMGTTLWHKTFMVKKLKTVLSAMWKYKQIL